MKNFNVLCVTFLSLLAFSLINFSKNNSSLTQPERLAIIYEEMDTNNIDYVSFMFTNLFGDLHEIYIPTQYAYNLLAKGLTFDGSSVPGCTNIQESDMYLQPDLSTFTILPIDLDESKSARIICTMYMPDGVTPYVGDPRYLLKQLCKKTRNELGFDFLIGSEIEFFLFKNVNDQIALCDTRSYCAAEDNLEIKRIMQSMVKKLRKYGIDIEKWHHEVAPSQYEIVLHYTNAVDMADQIVLAKHYLQLCAQEDGYTISFMPKPIQGYNGSALHMHFSLFDTVKNCNAFYSKSDANNLSPLAKQFIAGILKHLRQGTAVFNPNLNSFKRLNSGCEAPKHICLSARNRSASVRLPATSQSKEIRAELRSPDAMSNPYLAMLFMLKAGLAGIENKEKFPAYIDENLYTLSEKALKKHGINTLPLSLEAALNEMLNSKFMNNLLGEALLSEFIKAKKDEIEKFNQTITNWETKHYL